jgi:DNA-binding NarL/FixJ family response regulator
MEATIGFDGVHRATATRSPMRPLPDMASAAAQTVRVMVAVELALFRRGLAELIRQVLPGVDITEAEDLATAAELLADCPADLLIADVDGAGAEARLLLQHVCLECPGLKVAVLVGQTEDRVAALSWLEAGAHGCLPKAASPEELCDALRIIRAGNGYVSSSLLAPPVPGPRVRPAGEALPLTTRQQDVLRLLAEGRSSKDIARRLDLSLSTVKAHLAAAYRSLGAHNRVEALVRSRGSDQTALG